MKHPSNRAHRRANRQAVINHRRHTISWVQSSLRWIEKTQQGPLKDRWIGQQLGSIAKTPCPCSCAMCGNPRRYGFYQRLTLAELKALDGMEDGMAEWDQVH